jgi:hypothetical protein
MATIQTVLLSDDCESVVEKPVALYECGDCGTVFSPADSADGQSSRCPDCEQPAAKLTDRGCPDCEDANCREATGIVCPHGDGFVEVD